MWKTLAAVITMGIIMFGGHAVASDLLGTHHWFAPSNPYGPCPAGSHYTNYWFPPGNPENKVPVQAGVVKWFGWTEIASCSGSVTIGVGT